MVWFILKTYTYKYWKLSHFLQPNAAFGCQYMTDKRAVLQDLEKSQGKFVFKTVNFLFS